MRLLRLLIALALLSVSAVLVPQLWAAHWRFSAIVIALLTANTLFLMWWQHVMSLNRSHDAALGQRRDGE